MEQKEIILNLKLQATRELMQTAREARNRELYMKLKKEYRRLAAIINQGDSDASQ